MQAEAAQGRWFHLDSPRHLFHFTRRSRDIALEQIGFEVVERGTFSLVQDPMGWIQSALHTLGAKRDGVYSLMIRGGRPLDAKALLDVGIAASMLPAAALSVGEAAIGRGGTLSVWARPKGA